MTLLSYEQLEEEVNKLAGVINAPKDKLPTYKTSRDFAYPHIEIDKSNYHFVILERGTELERKSTHDLDELLYIIFEGVTFSMAGDFELNNRVDGQDCRRFMFQKQIELLSLLSTQWAKRCSKHQEDVLKENPFNDS